MEKLPYKIGLLLILQTTEARDQLWDNPLMQ